MADPRFPGFPDPRSQAQAAAKRRREEELRDLAELLGMPSGAGGRLVKRLLAACGTYADVYDPSAPGSKIHYNAGQQALGQWLVRECLEAAPEEWLRLYTHSVKELMFSQIRKDQDTNSKEKVS